LIQAQECFLQKATLYNSVLVTIYLVISSGLSLSCDRPLYNLQILVVHVLQFSTSLQITFTFVSHGFLLGSTSAPNIYVLAEGYQEEIFWGWTDIVTLLTPEPELSGFF